MSCVESLLYLGRAVQPCGSVEHVADGDEMVRRQGQCKQRKKGIGYPMKYSRNRGIGLAILLLFLALFGIVGRKVYREVRQSELNSALIAAVKKNDTPKVVSLLREGANANAGNIPVDTRPLWRRLWDHLRGKPLPSGHEHTALLVAVEMNLENPALFPPENVPLIKALLDAGATVNIADENGSTPLLWAAKASKRETVRLLLAKKADVNAESNTGSTALNCAVFQDDPALVKLLITQGALVNARGMRNAIPLHDAASCGNTTIARMLLDNGGDINARNNDGDTPLSSAALGDHFETVKLLLERGSSVNNKDNNGNTAMTWARNQHDTQMIQRLKAAALQQVSRKR